MTQQGGWSFLELVLVMAILGLTVGASAHWLGGKSGVSASVVRDELVILLRQQQLQQMDSITPRLYQWQSDRITIDDNRVLFTLDAPLRFEGFPADLPWQWDAFGRFRTFSQGLWCKSPCTISVVGKKDRADLCLDGEGGIWPQACAPS